MHSQETKFLQKPERVVLLGGTGFIGAAIHRRLEELAVPVLSTSSRELNLAGNTATEQLKALVKPTDAIVVVAAITPDKGRDAAALIKNIAIMRSICEAISTSGCEHLVYFSSDAVYDTAMSRVTEETSASPQDLYGAMHYTREIMARSLANIPVMVLRPTLVYGIDDTHNSYGPNRFRRAAQKDGKITLFGKGEETRDHIHVDDVATLTARCLIERKTGTLNIATGGSKSFSDIARIVGKQFSNTISINTTVRANPITQRHYDVTNLIKAFPNFRFIDIETGLARVHGEMMGAL